MSVYFVTGKLGAGKTLAAVGRIRDAMRQGKRIATNLNLFPEHLVGPNNRTSIIRLPDKPRLIDLQAIGYGCDKPDYTGKEFGLIVLDELGSWFNTRAWADKERLPVLDWFLHARKLRWDIIFIVQDIEAVDKQLREALCEHLVRVRRLDKFALPIFGRFIKFLTGITVKMPQIHCATVYYEDRIDPVMFVERWWYRGRDLYAGYDTGQIFQSGFEVVGAEVRDMRAVSTTLSAWHVLGRHPTSPRGPGLWSVIARMPFLTPFILWALLLSLGGGRSPAARLVSWGLCRARVSSATSSAPGVQSSDLSGTSGAVPPGALPVSAIATVRAPDFLAFRRSLPPLAKPSSRSTTACQRPGAVIG
jgi:hypothetical protein